MRVVNSPSKQSGGVLPPVFDRRLTNSQVPQSLLPMSPKELKERAQAATEMALKQAGFSPKFHEKAPQALALSPTQAGSFNRKEQEKIRRKLQNYDFDFLKSHVPGNRSSVLGGGSNPNNSITFPLSSNSISQQ